MEVNNKVQREYDPSHPNYERWQRARELSDDRAKFVETLLSDEIDVNGLMILNIGAGEGSTSTLLSKKNFVVSLEIKSERIKKISITDSHQPVIADCLKLPFKDFAFDLIILQDVIEHIIFQNKFVKELKGLLKKNGTIYLSSPNRLSIFNIISDPHWGMPFVSLLKRDQTKKYFLKNFRKRDYSREDIAELFSLRRIIDLFKEDFSISLKTKYSVNYLLNGGRGLIWSKFHLRLIKIVKILGLKEILTNIANDKLGIINKYFNPTFYLVLKKK